LGQDVHSKVPVAYVWPAPDLQADFSELVDQSMRGLLRPISKVAMVCRRLRGCTVVPNSLTGPRDGSPAWCIIAAVAGPAAVIRMLAPQASDQPRSRRFWLGAAFCDFSEAVTGSGASPVAAVVVGAAAVVVAVLFTGFENAQSQRRPEKPRVASVHLRPRPVALPHLR